MSNEQEAKTMLGCVVAVIVFFVTMPIWYALLFFLLKHNDAPTWAWAAYWVYVPANFLGTILTRAADSLMKDIQEIRDRLMMMEANDVAFDCRQECIDLYDALSELRAEHFELKSLVEKIVKQETCDG